MENENRGNLTDTVYQCAECNRQTDFSIYMSTSCNTCKKDFCDALNHDCFYRHHKKTGCKGIACTITNPKWIINLRKTLTSQS